MKAYWDAGLKQLAAASSFRGETLTSLSKCSNYSITTSFLLEVWEALYTCMLTTFLKQRKCRSTDSLLKSLSELTSRPHSREEFLKYISASALADLQSEFHQFVTKMASAGSNSHLMTAVRLQVYTSQYGQETGYCVSNPLRTWHHCFLHSIDPTIRR